MVHEEIKAAGRPGGRRSIADFFDRNGQVLDVMIAFSFGDTGVEQAPDLEVLAWDAVAGVFNYYKLDDERPSGTGQSEVSRQPLSTPMSCVRTSGKARVWAAIPAACR